MFMEKKKKEPWRIVVFVAAVLYILWMWVKKDISATLATLPEEQALPIIITSLAVTLVKVAVLAGAVLLGKWLLGKLRK